MTHSPISAGTGPQLDPQQIAMLRGLRNGTLLPQLLRAYREQADRLITEICRAAESGDLAVLRAIAHQLKSASFSVGATHVGRLCEQLEADANANALPGTDLCLELQERFSLLKPELAEYLTP